MKAILEGKRKGNRGRGAKNKIPVFGILERNGKVKVEMRVFQKSTSSF